MTSSWSASRDAADKSTSASIVISPFPNQAFRAAHIREWRISNLDLAVAVPGCVSERDWAPVPRLSLFEPPLLSSTHAGAVPWEVEGPAHDVTPNYKVILGQRANRNYTTKLLPSAQPYVDEGPRRATGPRQSYWETLCRHLFGRIFDPCSRRCAPNIDAISNSQNLFSIWDSEKSPLQPVAANATQSVCTWCLLKYGLSRREELHIEADHC
ncbi:hypothetical protein QBC41DRAFT_38673 [Cercophora samala]|uniref:Uncharacterized protein n=1 Tax=Cercophora samala TaxID=330535 RepID=A0AA39ZJ40_9PEZI|nr:hypothetical protein QBC41DRAFT_38673 [Cercophora samala]